MSTAYNSLSLKRMVVSQSNVWKWRVSKNVSTDKCPHKHLWIEKPRHKHVTRSCRSCRSCWCTDCWVLICIVPKHAVTDLPIFQSSSESKHLNLNILKAVQSCLSANTFTSRGRWPLTILGPTQWELGRCGRKSWISKLIQNYDFCY